MKSQRNLPHGIKKGTCGQRILITGHIDVLSPLAAANGLVQTWPHLINGSFSQRESAPKRHLDQFSYFAYTAAKIPDVFNRADKTPKLPFFVGQGPHLIHSSFGPPDSAPKWPASQSVQPNILKKYICCAEETVPTVRVLVERTAQRRTQGLV